MITGSEMYFLALSIGFSLSLVALIAVLFSKKTNSSHFYMGNIDSKHIDPKMVKMVNFIGGDLISLVPKKIQKRSIADKKVDDAFRESGNPWGVTKMEFFALRLAYAFVAFLISAIFLIIVQPGLLLSGIITLLLTYLGWNRPLSQYRSIANKRADDFKKHFPEMLDYLTMIMSDGNYTLANAIETVVPYLPESTVKEEFTRVVDSVNSGMNVESALNDLAERLPSPGLEAFVRAVNNANQLNTPMDTLMKTRAKKSREDLINEIELIIQTMPTKTMLTVAPPAILSMLVIFMVPVIVALLATI